MPSLLRRHDCPCCGRTHNFCLPVGEVSPGAAYEFVCPETGRRADFRAESTGEPSEVYLQGAVALESVRAAA